MLTKKVFFYVSLFFNFLFSIAVFYLIFSVNIDTETKNNDLHDTNFGEEKVLFLDQDLLEKKWYSPSRNKFIFYEYKSRTDPRTNTLHLLLSDKSSSTSIGDMNEVLTDLEVQWSPDENFAYIQRHGAENKLICVARENGVCDSSPLLTTYGGSSLYWVDDTTAYIMYYRFGNDVISKLEVSFDPLDITETVFYEEPWNAYFGASPRSVSDDGRYLLLSQSYESPSFLVVLDTRTGKKQQLTWKSDDPEESTFYVVDGTTTFEWIGANVTFTGVAAKSENFNFDLYDYSEFPEQVTLKDNLVEKFTVNVTAQAQQ